MPLFDPAVATFYRGLARHNTREWFAAHREDYDRLVRGPLEHLLAEAEARYGPGRIMRPNRDVRFTPDKSPYTIGGSLYAGEVGGVYLRLDARGIEAGGGLYEPSRDQLKRGRAAIDARPTAVAELQRALDGLEEAAFEIAGPALKTAPRGWPRNHPRIELLRLRHYAAVRHLPLDAPHRAALGAWHAVEPLLEWAGTYVGAAESWP